MLGLGNSNRHNHDRRTLPALRHHSNAKRVIALQPFTLEGHPAPRHLHAMSAPRHLVAVWNPSYEEDALDLHSRLLLDLLGNRNIAPDDIYVWWGRVRSPNRQQALPHLKDVLALDAEAAERELHLYLTD
jgi:hypothetical protein